ncbi:hypothetical protein ABT147_46055 [Streptomyces sp. NPDC001868]|uniref:hypothetical protein n=1 Tax=Streptomyces sp. NPDC001868 TaxID=3154401 RepID=UPI00331C945E
MKVSAGSAEDLGLFLHHLGTHLREIEASVTIDLYADFEIEEPDAKKEFEEFRARIVRASESQPQRGFWSRFARKPERFMGVPLDLTTDEGIRTFSLLAPRVIGCEGYRNKKVIFSTIENENIVRLDIPEQEVSRIVAQAHLSGAVSVIATD